MKKLSLKNKLWLINNSQTNHRKELKSKRRRTTKRLLRQKRQRKNSSRYIPKSWTRKEIQLDVPPNFCLSQDLRTVIAFISLLKSYTNISDEVRSVFLNLASIQRIDIGSISLLLSSIRELGIHDINVRGSLPEDEECNKVLQQSGFFEHMPVMSERLKRSIRTSNPENKNLMIMKGRDKTNHREIGASIKRAVSMLTGREEHYPPLYGVIGEMNINAVEHAYKKDKHWVFAVNHDEDNNRVIFTFTDNGFGIFKTLKRNFGLKAFELLGLKDESQIVEGMFREEYSSRFKKQYNRNKGLPAIRMLQMKKKVDNLSVITNNIYINFQTGTKIDLKDSFSGTFYYWELNLATYENK